VAAIADQRRQEALAMDQPHQSGACFGKVTLEM